MRDAIHIFVFILTTLLVAAHLDIAFSSHDTTSMIEMVSSEFEVETEVETEFEYVSADINNGVNSLLDNEFYFTKNLNGIELVDNYTPPPE